MGTRNKRASSHVGGTHSFEQCDQKKRTPSVGTSRIRKRRSTRDSESIQRTTASINVYADINVSIILANCCEFSSDHDHASNHPSISGYVWLSFFERHVLVNI